MSARKWGEGKTPHRTFRIEDERWVPFGENAGRVGQDRTSLLNEFVAWFNREPGAKLPKRPEAD